MGSDICSTKSAQCGLELQDKNTFIKCSSFKTHITKPYNNSDQFTRQSQIYSTDSQLIYKGQIKNSKFHGYGKLFQGDKLFYEGQFKNGFFQGWGMTQNYTGQFRQGLFDGYGIYQDFLSQDKTTVNFYYQGYFSLGKFSGHGIQIKNAQIPVNEINKAHQNEGMNDKILSTIQKGSSKSKNFQAEQIYIGQFTKGYKNGFGRLFKDNKQYSGSFVAGQTSVKGTVINFQLSQKKQRQEQQIQRQEKQIRRQEKRKKSCITC